MMYLELLCHFCVEPQTRDGRENIRAGPVSVASTGITIDGTSVDTPIWPLSLDAAVPVESHTSSRLVPLCRMTCGCIGSGFPNLSGRCLEVRLV